MENRGRLTIFAWATGLLFFSISVLSASNPIYLLLPGRFLTPPMQEQLKPVRLYGLSREDHKLIPVTREIYLGENIEKNIEHLAFVTARTHSLRQGLLDQTYKNLTPLPQLGFAIRKIWYRPKNDGGLLVDLRRTTIIQEMKKFTKQYGVKTNRNSFYLDGYFQTLTASIFETQPDIQSIRYLLDGKIAALRGMQFDLSLKYLR